MIVVSGCPRSGTSLMMDLMRVTFGEDRILGKKFPQEERLKFYNKKQENESETEFSLRQYIQAKNQHKDPIEEFEKTKDMNPNGFWEMLYTVQGCYYRFQDTDRLETLLNEDKPSICKIVSQGLMKSDPRYISKVIYMMRHPRAVAKSQERLRRNMPSIQTEDGVIEMEDELTIHTPEMYINVTLMACRWLRKYPKVPVHFVKYDELIKTPGPTLNKVKTFLGEGDFTKAIDQINPDLWRSHPEDIEHRLWTIADSIYDLFLEGKFQECIDFMEENKDEFRKEQSQWICARRNMPASEDICKICQTDKVVRGRFKETSERMRIDWQNEPCLYECGMGVGIDHITVGDSVENNHWSQ